MKNGMNQASSHIALSILGQSICLFLSPSLSPALCSPLFPFPTEKSGLLIVKGLVLGPVNLKVQC